MEKDCGEIFGMSWGNATTGNGCGFCHGLQVGLSNCLATKNPELTKEWHPILNGDLTPFDVTESSNQKVWWQCKDNPKHEWEAIIASRNGGSRCLYCIGKLPSEDYNLLVCNPKLCEEWNYERNKKNPEEYCPGSGKSVWWKCKECGNEWDIKINSRSNRTSGCPECGGSTGEKIIREFSSNNNLFYDIQYSFNDLLGVGGGLLRYDGSLFWDRERTKLRMLIEFDGKQHYEWTKWMMTEEGFKQLQTHDKLKNQYCISHNIPLIRIPYWEIDNIELILTDILIHNNMDSKFIIKE